MLVHKSAGHACAEHTAIALAMRRDAAPRMSVPCRSRNAQEGGRTRRVVLHAHAVVLEQHRRAGRARRAGQRLPGGRRRGGRGRRRRLRRRRLLHRGGLLRHDHLVRLRRAPAAQQTVHGKACAVCAAACAPALLPPAAARPSGAARTTPAAQHSVHDKKCVLDVLPPALLRCWQRMRLQHKHRALLCKSTPSPASRFSSSSCGWTKVTTPVAPPSAAPLLGAVRQRRAAYLHLSFSTLRPALQCRLQLQQAPASACNALTARFLQVMHTPRRCSAS
jgi:hypothetical protein